MSSTKYAIVINDVIDSVSYDPDRERVVDYETAEVVGDDGEPTGETVQVEVGWHWGDVLPPWVAIPDEVFAGFVQQEGEWVNPNLPEAPALPAIKAALKTLVDAAAEAERLKYITPGAGQAMTYQQKAAEAARYLTAADPTPADYPMLSAEVGITAETLEGVADVVNSAFTQWQQIGAAIEAIRLSAKAGIENADDAEAAQAIFDVVVWPAP